VRRAPALVFIAREDQLAEVTEQVDPMALRLARALWPQSLTIRVKPHPDLPGKVLKQLGGSKSRIGVRVPADPFIHALLDQVGRPLLVSSANKEARSGDGSPAQVRKSFSAHVDLFVDRGDLASEPPSTVVEVRDGEVVVERAGVISAQAIKAAAAAP
jgi:L-threonylcarbamoyladenylate synthase